MIEVANMQLPELCRHINHHLEYSQHATFSADSCLIVLEKMDTEECPVTMEVFTRNGCHLAHNITYSCGFCMPWTECIKGSRIAVARQLYFVVWDLQTGHRLSTQHPPAGLKRPASPAVEHGSKLVISPTGAKLAFCAASTSTVHLYDAASLALLGCVDPFVGMQPEVHRPLIGRLVWSVFGWLVPNWQYGDHDRAHYLHFLRPQEGCNKYLKQVLCCIAQPVAGCAFSPDAVFLCVHSSKARGLAHPRHPLWSPGCQTCCRAGPQGLQVIHKKGSE